MSGTWLAEGRTCVWGVDGGKLSRRPHSRTSMSRYKAKGEGEKETPEYTGNSNGSLCSSSPFSRLARKEMCIVSLTPSASLSLSLSSIPPTTTTARHPRFRRSPSVAFLPPCEPRCSPVSLGRNKSRLANTGRAASSYYTVAGSEYVGIRLALIYKEEKFTTPGSRYICLRSPAEPPLSGCAFPLPALRSHYGVSRSRNSC